MLPALLECLIGRGMNRSTAATAEAEVRIAVRSCCSRDGNLSVEPRQSDIPHWRSQQVSEPCIPAVRIRQRSQSKIRAKSSRPVRSNDKSRPLIQSHPRGISAASPESPLRFHQLQLAHHVDCRRHEPHLACAQRAASLLRNYGHGRCKARRSGAQVPPRMHGASFEHPHVGRIRGISSVYREGFRPSNT